MREESLPEQVIIQIYGHAVTLFQAALIFVSGLLLICIGLTLSGVYADSARVISAAGLAWLILCYLMYALIQMGGSIAQWITEAAQTLSQGLRQIPVLGVIAFIANAVREATASFLFTALGACGVVAKLISTLHIYLGRGVAEDVGSAVALFSHWSIEGVFAIVPFICGVVADFGFTNHPHRKAVARASAKFFTSFELLRSGFIFVCGLSGREALRAADAVLDIPNHETLIPLGAFSQEARDSALFLFGLMGPFLFWSLFGVIPLYLALYGTISFIRNRLRGFFRLIVSTIITDISVPNFRLPLSERSTVAAGWWMLLLSATVAFRSGELEWWTWRLDAAFNKHPAIVHAVSCIAPIRGAKGGELACWREAERILEQELQRLFDRQLKASLPKLHAGIRKEFAVWRVALDSGTVNRSQVRLRPTAEKNPQIVQSQERIRTLRERCHEIAEKLK